MEKRTGNEQLPDFKELGDRIIAKPTSSPHLVIKTNLDPKDVTEGNPYHTGTTDKNFRDYFEGE